MCVIPSWLVLHEEHRKEYFEAMCSPGTAALLTQVQSATAVLSLLYGAAAALEGLYRNLLTNR